MSGVFTRLVGQSAAEVELVAAAVAARGDSAHGAVNPAAMTHAWLITGPPGSGRSVAALWPTNLVKTPDIACQH